MIVVPDHAGYVSFSGTCPDLLIHCVDRRIIYGSYLQTHLEGGIRRIQNIQDISLFQGFLELPAGRAGQQLNLSALARDLGLHNVRHNVDSLSRKVFVSRTCCACFTATGASGW